MIFDGNKNDFLTVRKHFLTEKTGQFFDGKKQFLTARKTIF